MSPELVSLLIQALQFAWTILLTVYVFNRREGAQLRGELDALKKGLADALAEISALRADLHSRPSTTGLTDSFGKVYERINQAHSETQGKLLELTGKIGEISGTLRALAPAIAILNQNAIEANRHG